MAQAVQAAHMVLASRSMTRGGPGGCHEREGAPATCKRKRAYNLTLSTWAPLGAGCRGMQAACVSPLRLGAGLIPDRCYIRRKAFAPCHAGWLRAPEAAATHMKEQTVPTGSPTLGPFRRGMRTMWLLTDVDPYTTSQPRQLPKNGGPKRLPLGSSKAEPAITNNTQTKLLSRCR